MRKRGHFLTFLIILILVLPVTLFTIPEVRAVRLGESFTCKFIDNNLRWEKKTDQFDPTDVAVYVYTQLVECVVNAQYALQWNFRNPNNEIYYTVGPTTWIAGGTVQTRAAYMNIVGRAPEKQLGKWAVEIYYWAQAWVFGSKLEFTIGKTEAPKSSFTVTVDGNEKTVPITVDGTPYSDLPKIFTWEKDSVHSITAKKEVPGSEGVRYVFESWSDGSTSLSRSITVTGPVTYSANYKTQYYLTVISEQGEPSGGGWYDAGSNAYATLDTSSVPADFFNNYVLKGWKGDGRGSQPKSSAIKMDAPKTAEAIWEKQFNMTFYIVIVVIVGVVGAVVFLRFRPPAKKKEVSPTPPTSPEKPIAPV